MQTPRIRPARPAEAPELSALALRSKAHWGYSPAFIEACRDELSVSPADLQDGPSFLCRVAELDDEVVGYYALERIDALEWELDALFIDPAFIGRGVGRVLLAHARDCAAGLGARALLIQGDPNAEGFYRAMGAERVGERESGSVPGRYLPLFRIHLDPPQAGRNDRVGRD